MSQQIRLFFFLVFYLLLIPTEVGAHVLFPVTVSARGRWSQVGGFLLGIPGVLGSFFSGPEDFGESLLQPSEVLDICAA